MLTGIDVSGHQGPDPDLNADIIGIKASEGMAGRNKDFAAQLAKARKLGRRVQFYHFSWPAQDIGRELANFLAVVRPVLEPGDVCVLDWEWYAPDNLPTNAQAAAYKRRWFELAREALPGHRHILYTNAARWNDKNLNPDKAQGDGLWIAHYGVPQGNPGISDPWLGHQWTGTTLDRSVWQFDSLAAYDQWANPAEPDPLADLRRQVAELDVWADTVDQRLDQLADTDRAVQRVDQQAAELIARLTARVAELERLMSLPLTVRLTATREG